MNKFRPGIEKGFLTMGGEPGAAPGIGMLWPGTSCAQEGAQQLHGEFVPTMHREVKHGYKHQIC